MRHLQTIINKYIKKIENRITFKIKIVYFFELRTPEMMKVLGNTKSKITKDENFDNVPPLVEITEVVLFHCDIVNNDYQHDSKVLYIFVPNAPCGKLQDISPKIFIIFKRCNKQ